MEFRAALTLLLLPEHQLIAPWPGPGRQGEDKDTCRQRSPSGGTEQGVQWGRMNPQLPREAMQSIYLTRSSSSTLVIVPMKNTWPQQREPAQSLVGVIMPNYTITPLSVPSCSASQFQPVMVPISFCHQMRVSCKYVCNQFMTMGFCNYHAGIKSLDSLSIPIQMY